MILRVKHYVIIDNYIIIVYLINVCDGKIYYIDSFCLKKGQKRGIYNIIPIEQKTGRSMTKNWPWRPVAASFFCFL